MKETIGGLIVGTLMVGGVVGFFLFFPFGIEYVGHWWNRAAIWGCEVNGAHAVATTSYGGIRIDCVLGTESNARGSEATAQE